MRILDSRRLTGPSSLLPRAGVVAEIAFDAGEEIEALIALWRIELQRACQLLGIAFADVSVRRFSGSERSGFADGALFGFTAPIDVLLAASDLNDLVIARAADFLAQRPLAPLDVSLALLRETLQHQANARLLALEAEAKRRTLPFLWDDSEISLGAGAHSRSYSVAELPEISRVPWNELGSIPVALVNGTNGKTTTARLLAHLASQAGRRCGLAATDYIAVDGEVIERGDFTGPAAARLVLRDRRVELAVLETARGGILRRGLAVDRVQCAAITNVADDHLGEYGIDSVRALARAKAVVASAVEPHGRIVLNADDANLLALVRQQPELFAAPIIWFSLSPASLPELVRIHLQTGGEAFLLEDGALVRRKGTAHETILLAREAPVTLGGNALYNIANALAAAALATALGLSLEAIARGLKSFRPDRNNNPGRGNLFVNGTGESAVRVLIDFAHNAAGVHEIGKLAANLLAARPGALSVISGCAGDRSDENLRALAVEIAAMHPKRVLLRDLTDYLRGRAPGEVPEKLRGMLEGLGVARSSLDIRESEVDALRSALDGASAGELVLVLVHLEDEAVQALLASRGFRGAP